MIFTVLVAINKYFTMKKITLICTLILVFQFQLNAQKTKQDFVALAVENVQKKNYEAAINFFTYVIENFEQDSLAYFDRGLVKKMMRDYDGAIADFTAQIKFDSTNADSYFLRGIVKDHLEDYKGAVKDYQSAIHFDFGNSDAHFFLGRDKLRLGQIYESQQDFRDAVQINSDNAPAWAFSAWAKIQLNDYDEAQRELDLALKIDSSDVQTLYFQAFLDAELQHFDQSFQCILKAINIHPTFGIQYLKSTKAKHKTKNFKPLLIQFNSNLNAENQTTKDLIIHGFANLYLNDYRSAKKYFETVIQKNKTNHVAFYGLALLHFQNKKYTDALANINLALEFIPCEENYENMKDRIKRLI
jgi:tetratricopeptide (TPR) repeat protein